MLNTPVERDIEDINRESPIKAKRYNLKFCALINSHDKFNSRIPILKKLETISFIDCPGKLNHNVKLISKNIKEIILTMK